MAELARLETGERVRVLGGRNFEKLTPELKDNLNSQSKQSVM